MSPFTLVPRGPLRARDPSSPVERKWVERNGSNRPPVPWVESSPFRNWVEWTWVDLEKCQVLGRQHIDFDPIPFDPIRPQSIRPKLFDQKGRPNSFRPISFDPFHAILRHQPFGRQNVVGHMGDKSVDQMG